jgi:hypothetical protein
VCGSTSFRLEGRTEPLAVLVTRNDGRFCTDQQLFPTSTGPTKSDSSGTSKQADSELAFFVLVACLQRRCIFRSQHLGIEGKVVASISDPRTRGYYLCKTL